MARRNEQDISRGCDSHTIDAAHCAQQKDRGCIEGKFYCLEPVAATCCSKERPVSNSQRAALLQPVRPKTFLDKAGSPEIGQRQMQMVHREAQYVQCCSQTHTFDMHKHLPGTRLPCKVLKSLGAHSLCEAGRLDPYISHDAMKLTFPKASRSRSEARQAARRSLSVWPLACCLAAAALAPGTIPAATAFSTCP